MSHYALGKAFAFQVGSLPSADRKAADHLKTGIEVCLDIGARSIAGQAYLDLGLMHMALGEKDRAGECISEAIELFERCEAETLLKQAREALESVG